MNTWNLKIEKCYEEVFYGRDEQRRKDIYLALIDVYTKDVLKKCLQIGVPHCVSHKYAPHWIALDPFDKRDCIDRREKLEETKLPDNEFDLIVCNAVLEHVEDPFGCARELYRICKPGGKIWCEVPFVQPYHPHKNWKLEDGLFYQTHDLKDDENHGGDYWRFTPQGMMQLMNKFSVIEILLINQGGIAYFGQKLKNEYIAR